MGNRGARVLRFELDLTRERSVGSCRPMTAVSGTTACTANRARKLARGDTLLGLMRSRFADLSTI
jgi:hypothetical protein